MDLICFDLDNTLLNSERANVYSYNFALRKNGFPSKKFDYVAKLFGRPHEEVVSILINSKNKEIINKISRNQKASLVNKFYKYASVKGGIRTTLKKLGKKHDLAIVSNASHKSILALLMGAKLDKRYFSVIIGNDDVKHSKPYPDEILKAEKLVHHRAKWMIGDSIYDVLAGKRAKVKTIAVLSGRYTKRQLNQVKPDYIVMSLKEVLNIL